MNRLHHLDVLTAWYREYMTVKNFRPRSIKNALHDLSFFRRFLEGKTELADIDDLTPSLLHDYAAYLYDRGNSASTIHRKLSTLSSFFGAVYENKKLYADYRGYVHLPRLNKTLPSNIPTEEDTRRVFAYLESATNALLVKNKNDAVLLRDRAVFEVLYSSGLRRNELTGLTLADVDYDGGFMFVRQGKGGKDRLVPVGRTALESLRRYVLEARPLLAANDCDALFVSRRGFKMGDMTIKEGVERVTKAAGLRKHVRVHALRHACATHLLNAGADIRYVQELLGHACLTSTQVYTHVSISKLKETHAKHHPRENGSARLTDQEEI